MLKSFSPTVKGSVFQVDYFLVVTFFYSMFMGYRRKELKIPVTILMPPT